MNFVAGTYLVVKKNQFCNFASCESLKKFSGRVRKEKTVVSTWLWTCYIIHGTRLGQRFGARRSTCNSWLNLSTHCQYQNIWCCNNWINMLVLFITIADFVLFEWSLWWLWKVTYTDLSVLTDNSTVICRMLQSAFYPMLVSYIVALKWLSSVT